MNDPATAFRRHLMMASGDRRKLEVYIQHLPELVGADPAAALACANEAYYLAVVRGGGDDRATILRFRANINLHIGDVEKAASDLREAYEIYESTHEAARRDARRADLVSIAIELGKAWLSLDDYRAALQWYQRALVHCASRRDTVHAGVLLELGDLYRRVGDYDRATATLFDARAIAEEMDAPESVGAIFSALGATFELIGNDDSARDFYALALEKSTAAGNHRAMIQSLRHLAGIHRRSGNFAKAVELALKAHAAYEAMGDRVGVSEALVEIGDIHEEMGKREIAFEFHHKAYISLPPHVGNALRLPILFRVGRWHLRRGETQRALVTLRWALDIAVELGDQQMQCDIYESLIMVAKALSNYKDAFEYQSHVASIRAGLAGDEQRRAIVELQVRFDMEKAERDLEISRQRALALEREMDAKKAELTALAVSLVEKEKTLERLQVKVGQLRETIGDGGDEIIAEILSDINRKRSPADDWKRFELELNRIHPDFTRNLIARAGTLTPAELRICYLTKLNHSVKDIASMIGVSSRTIETQRFKIRKKLGLEPSVNLTSFLAGL